MALQTLWVYASGVKCYRSGWKTDVARFGTGSGGHYTSSQIIFTPGSEDLQKLRNARITKVIAGLTFARLGGDGTKTIGFDCGGLDYSIQVTQAYDKMRYPLIWTGDSSTQSNSWGAYFLAALKKDSSITIDLTVPKATVPSGKDYASNYGGVKLPSYLEITYEPLSSELGISNNQTFDLGVLNTVSLIRYAGDYRETAFLNYEGKSLELVNSSTDTSKFSFTLPLNIANNMVNKSTVSGTINLITYSNGSQIGEEKNYNIQIRVPSSIFFKRGNNWAINGVSNKANKNYFIQGFSQAEITCNFTPFTENEFTDNATIKSCTIENLKLGISSQTMTNKGNNTFTYTTPILNISGSEFFNITVENSRGHKKTFQTETIRIQSYTIPQIINISLSRINEKGELMEEGNYLRWTGTLKYSNVTYGESSEKNIPVTLSLSHWNGSKSFSISSLNSSGTFSVDLIDTTIDGGLFKTDNSYEITAIVIDSLGRQSLERIATLSSTKYLIHFPTGGNGLGLGSAATNPNKITCGFDMFFNSDNGALKIAEGGTEAIDKEGAWNNIVSQGGIINKLTIQENALSGTRNRPCLNLVPLMGAEEWGKVQVKAGGSTESNIFLGGLEVWEAGTKPEKAALTLYKKEGIFPELKLGYSQPNASGTDVWSEYKIPSEKDLYYYPGNQIIIRGVLFGYLTSENALLIIMVPVSKRLEKINGVQINNFIGSMRAGGGTYGYNKDFKNEVKDSILLPEQNAVMLVLNGSYTGSANNNAIQLDLGYQVDENYKIVLTDPKTSGLIMTFT